MIWGTTAYLFLLYLPAAIGGGVLVKHAAPKAWKYTRRKLNIQPKK